MEIYSDYKIQKINKDDSSYPVCLGDLSDPPRTLYYRGNIVDIDFSKCLAVVGSRRMTTYGRQVLDKFISDLVANDVTIVSGFMYGVDTEAHKLAVEYGGKTIAVFGNGLDVVYPVENDKLYSQILDKNGVVLSEYTPRTKPHLWTYPKRNRIVAAISLLGTLVIEAGEDSGSLVTAKMARKLKRKVYAVPGPITSSVSVGTNNLIKKSLAKIVLNTKDVITIEHNTKSQSVEPLMSDLEANIYQILLRENLTLDELTLVINQDFTQVSTTVSIMTLKGLIEELGGKLIAKKNK